MSTHRPLLSVVCIAYNQERFIRECLDGFVMQKTDFPFEVLINDDASTDKTADIIREYEKKYPHLFRCVYQTENQWGKKSVWTDVLFPLVQGKYVALCEGDDYWTDPLKLQKQVDFLETHSDFSVCFHPVTVHWDDNSAPDTVFPDKKGRFGKTELTLTDLTQRNFIQTNAVVYRWRFHKDPLSLFPNDILPGDWFLHLLHAQTGKIGFLQDVMAVYRKNRGSVWLEALKTKKWFERCGYPYLRFLKEKESRFQCDEKDDFLFVLASFFQKTDKDNPLREELKRQYPTECLWIQNVKFVGLKYVVCAAAKFFSFGETKNFFKRKKKLYRVLKQMPRGE